MILKVAVKSKSASDTIPSYIRNSVHYERCRLTILILIISPSFFMWSDANKLVDRLINRLCAKNFLTKVF